MKRHVLAVCAMLVLAGSVAHAFNFGRVSIISSTLGDIPNRLCAGAATPAGQADIGCPSYSPYLTSGGLLGVGTSSPTATLQVGGSFIVSTSAAPTSPSLYVGADGKVGIGITNPATPLHVVGADGNLLTLTPGGGTQTNIGYLVINGRARFGYDGNQAVIIDDATSSKDILLNTSGVNRMKVTWDGNVGIGTATPTTALEVSGTISATHFVGDGSGLTGVTAASSDRITSGSTQMVVVSNTGYVSLTQAGTNTGWFDPARGLVTLGVSSTGPISGTGGYFSGNVGIGTTSPAATLDINGGTVTTNVPVFNAAQTWNNAGTAFTGIKFNATCTADNNYSLLMDLQQGGTSQFNVNEWGGATASSFQGATSNVNGFIIASGGNLTGGSQFFYRWTNNNPSTGTVDTSLSRYSAGVVSIGTGAWKDTTGTLLAGSVGIGTTSPTVTLTVANAANSSNTAQTFVALDNNTTGLGGAGLQFQTNNVNRARIEGWGPGGNQGDFRFITQDGPLGAESEKLRIAAGGNVGIGTTNPSKTLHVSGTVLTTSWTGINFSSTGNVTPSAPLEVSGTVSATHFVGDGSGLTGVTAASSDRITSGTTQMVVVSSTGYVSLTQASTNTGWFDPTRGLVTLGVSATGPISGTGGYFSGNVGIGTAAGTGQLGISSSGLGTPLYISVTNNSEGIRIVRGTDASQYFSLNEGNYSWHQIAAYGGPKNIRIVNNAYAGIMLDVNSTQNNGVYIAPNASSIFGSGIGNTPSATVHVSGTLLTTSWTGINFSSTGNVTPTAPLEVSGTISATHFVGDGSGLTGVTAASSDRITSGTTQMVVVSNTGFVSLTQASTNTGWFDPTRGLVTLGVSATGPISGTGGYFSGNVGIGSAFVVQQSPNNTGTDNFYAGNQAGVLNTAGYHNAGVGEQALSANTTGNENTGFGYIALGLNTTGYWNTGLGAGANYTNVSGRENTAVGADALNKNLAKNNTAVGSQALAANTTGTPNDAFGRNALLANTTGTNNAAFAISTLKSNIDGSYNVAMGASALDGNVHGNNNVAIGVYSLLTATGSNNTAIGNSAGSNLTTGSANILLGSNVGTPSNTTSNWLNIGNFISGSIATTGAIGFGGSVTVAGNAGIGTLTPTVPLEVSGTVSATHFVGDGSGLTGIASGDRITSGSTQMVVVSNTGYVSLTQASTNTGWFDPTRGLVTLGVSATGGLSGTTGYFSGNVGIGTAVPSQALHVIGNALISGDLRTNNTLHLANSGDTYLQSGGDGILQLNSAVRFNFGGSTSSYPAIAKNGSDLQIIRADGSTSANLLVSGNVGIGTTSPTASLHIYPPNGTIPLRLDTANTAGHSNYIDFDFQGVEWGYLGFGATSSDFYVSNGQSGNLLFKTNNSEYMRITSAGNVGIGTTAPGGLLDVNGRLTVDGDIYQSGGKVITNLDNQLYLQTGSSQPLIFRPNGSEAMRILVGGSVGIGTTNPSKTLHVSGTVLTTSWTGINFSSTGNVTPTAPLEVSGTVSATHFVGDGSGLTNLSLQGDRITSGTASVIANQNTGVSVSVPMDVSGSLGVGTTNPQATLDVSGSIRMSGTGTETCDAAHYNTLRIDPVTHSLEICQP